MKVKHTRKDKVLLSIGCILLMIETIKQIYLYLVVYHSYNVWYFPFQLCSTPMYLCILRYFMIRHEGVDSFLQNYAMLGGICALAVPDGFTNASHPLLTVHGYTWHILLISISLILAFHQPEKNIFVRIRRYGQGCIVFAILTVIAEIINVLFHSYGDCDMFYISPFHISTQPVFRDIDLIVGRRIGIVIYLFAIVLATFVIDLVLYFITKYMRQYKN